jgi:hypothetical protein
MWHGYRPDVLDNPRRSGLVVLAQLSGRRRPQTGRVPWLRHVPGWQEAGSNLLWADLQNAHRSKRSRGLLKYR